MNARAVIVEPIGGKSMINLIDFNKSPIANYVYYGGNAGAKDAVIYENNLWMLKYPKTTRDLMNPQISYTTSPLSEYIGSRIYEALDIPVHETVLGIRNNKMVVGCKDFTRIWVDDSIDGKGGWIHLRLVPFHDLKNSFMASDLELYSGTGSETLIDEVLATITGQNDLKIIPGVLERFWDMFVIDAFIGNNDRNNGNWGILIDEVNREATLAPVYDNGNAFFNKRNIASMEKRLTDEKAMQEDAYKTPRCVYKYTGTDTEGQQINPFTFIAQGENPDCNASALRFVNKLDFKMIEQIIYDIPEVSGTISVMPEVQKMFYLELMKIRLNQIIKSLHIKHLL